MQILKIFISPYTIILFSPQIFYNPVNNLFHKTIPRKFLDCSKHGSFSDLVDTPKS
jgi:hypothetical protein